MRRVPVRNFIVLTAALMLCSISQAAERTWIYEATGSRDPGVVRVEDPDALDGSALECPPSDRSYPAWFTFLSPYTMHVPGEYEVIFRLKVEDNTFSDHIFCLGELNGGTWEHVRGTHFKEPGAYQEFVYPFTIKVPVPNACTVRKLAGPRGWIDRVTVIQKRVFSDTDQLKTAGFNRPGELWLIPHEGINVWFVKGLYYQHYGIHNILEQMDAELDFAYFVRTNVNRLSGIPLQGKPPEVKPPESPAEVDNDEIVDDLGDDLLADLAAEERADEKRYENDAYNTVMSRDLIVLANVHADCLTVPQRAMIHDFVKAGDGLLIVGGPFSFGRGALADSELLESLLPVTTPVEYDLQPFQVPAPLKPANGRIALDGLNWADRPMVMWMHDAQPKPGATVELTAGGKPALVTWQYGKGRVAALTATVLGEPPENETAFWEWTDWPEVMEFVVQWLLPRE